MTINILMLALGIVMGVLGAEIATSIRAGAFARSRRADLSRVLGRDRTTHMFMGPPGNLPSGRRLPSAALAPTFSSAGGRDGRRI